MVSISSISQVKCSLGTFSPFISHSMEIATFGAGCYWGTEKYFRSNFNSRFPGSIVDVKVGFMGGRVPSPTYRQVCEGTTSHVEVAQVTFNPSVAPYEELVKFFFSFHDPTTPDRQGGDQGTQYASVIFAHSLEQRDVAKAVMARLQDMLNKNEVPFLTPKKAFEKTQLSTRIFPSRTFWPAEEDHQLYLFKNPQGYCNHKIRFVWPEWETAQKEALEKTKSDAGF